MKKYLDIFRIFSILLDGVFTTFITMTISNSSTASDPDPGSALEKNGSGSSSLTRFTDFLDMKNVQTFSS